MPYYYKLSKPKQYQILSMIMMIPWEDDRGNYLEVCKTKTT